jgi:hypothetical protein
LRLFRNPGSARAAPGERCPILNRRKMSFTHQSIIGTWHAELASDPSKTSIFRILDDFRYVSFAEYVRPDARRRWIPMRLWGGFDDDGAFRLRPRRTAAGWSRRISFDGDVMIIEATEPEHSAWRCRRLAVADIPEWFESEAALALDRPWK